MKSNTVLPLALALSIALFATACSRDTDDTLVDEPAVASAPIEPAPAAPMPAAPMPEPATTSVDSGMSFDAMDASGDDMITQDELAETEMLFQNFSAADVDGSGELSPEEVDGHRAAMAGSPAR
ncbi:MAG: hypothetical protein H0T88_09955 [Lysobacter sp.]|nr:hypothetical protein [Lysobacter sp.]